MKLLSLKVRSFLGIIEADLDLSHSLNLIQGRHGMGKSSIRQALRWGLWGRCRGTDKGGKGAFALIHGGETQAAVQITFLSGDGLEYSILRSQVGSEQMLTLTLPTGATLNGGAAQDRIDEAAGAGVDVGEICLDPLLFLQLDRRSQGTIFANAIGLRLDRTELLAQTKAYGLSEASTEALEAQLGLCIGYVDGRAVVGQEQLQAVYELIKARRRDLKKDRDTLEGELKALPQPLPAGSDKLDQYRNVVSDLSGREGKLREQLGALTARQEDHGKILARQAQLQAQSSALEAQAKEPQGTLPLGNGGSAEALEAEVAELRKGREAAAETVNAAGRDLIMAEAESKKAWDLVVQAREGKSDCPAHVTEAGCPILLAQVEERKKAIPQLTSAAKKLDQATMKARATKNEAGDAYQAAYAAMEDAEVRLRKSIEASAKATGKGAAEWDAIQAELDRLHEALETIGNPASEIVKLNIKLGEVCAQRSNASKDLAALELSEHSAKQREAVERKLAAKRDQVEIAEELTRALDPKALPARILESKIGLVQKGINQILSDVTGGKYRVAIEAGDSGVELSVFKEGSAYPLPSALLSDSELLRVGAALAVSLALITPLRTVVIDETNLLLPENGGQLWEAIAGLEGSLETAILISSAASPAGELGDEVGCFWVEDGKVYSSAASPAAAGAGR